MGVGGAVAERWEKSNDGRKNTFRDFGYRVLVCHRNLLCGVGIGLVAKVSHHLSGVLELGRSLGLGEELHSQEVASESHGSPVGTACSYHVAFAAQKDISLGSNDTLHRVFEGSLSKKRRLASDSVTEVPRYGEYDVTDVLCDVPVTISLGLSRGKEILGAQTKEVVPDNMPDECTGTMHNVNSFPPSCHEGSSSSGKRGFKRMREVCPRGCSNMNGVGQCGNSVGRLQ
ncbi:hypothetical protein Pyn_23608 [Prunus yedoensis var. nudiflora]|uniref:Uncharacterized protein n=1 Tax=Prunus yedoensis var. nudiflora TaxID=2094558 RepID=A0A314ZM11_PRUYE|nr:hypothetical protein Pyn_23608 [Prunus yedoensis var. nudiflora]